MNANEMNKIRCLFWQWILFGVSWRSEAKKKLAKMPIKEYMKLQTKQVGL